MIFVVVFYFMHTEIMEIVSYLMILLFSLLLHIVIATFIKLTTFCFVFVDFARRQIESEMFCYSNYSADHGNRYILLIEFSFNTVLFFLEKHSQ